MSSGLFSSQSEIKGKRDLMISELTSTFNFDFPKPLREERTQATGARKLLGEEEGTF